MFPLFKVLKPGLLTTVQDPGRLGNRHFGVPVSGGVDGWALKAANVLVGNNPACACLETTLSGPTIQFLCDCAAAITGADMQPELSGTPVPLWESFYCRSGEILRFGYKKTGCRSYIAFSGGIEVPVVLGSRSTFLTAGFGGFQGRRLEAEDILNTSVVDTGRDNIGLRYPEYVRPVYSPEIKVRTLMGIDRDCFSQKDYARFHSETFTVTNRLNRTGCSLAGPMISTESPAVAESFPVAPGSIQITPAGNPIVLLHDAQSTGGYPQIAVVITADLGQLGQAVPGDKIIFEETDGKTAQKLLTSRTEELYCLEMASEFKAYRMTTKHEYEIVISKNK